MNKFIVGLVLGIAIAGGLAVYLNNAPTPFLNKQLVSTANNSSGTLILQPGTTIKSSASADDGDVSTPSAPKIMPRKVIMIFMMFYNRKKL